MKTYTDLEQSKKLAEILPIESADIFYRDNGIDAKLMWEHNAQKVKYPCWSLAALMELTPNDVSLLHLEDVFQAVYDVKPYHITNRYDNPLDAAFEMICWLKENNKL